MKSRHIRLAAQIFFFLLVGIITTNHILAENGGGLAFIPSVSLHAICPFGSIETLASLVTGAGLVRQLHASVMVLGAAVLIVTLLFGPIFCSHICPLGSVQEWVGKFGRRVFKKRYNKLIPKKVHNVLKYLRYVVLILIVWQTYQSAALLFTNVDPYYALYHFWTGEATVAAIVVLAATLVMSLFVERPWCKYLCPYGGLLGLISKISLFKIHRSVATCIDCAKCDEQCPMLIDVSSKKTVRDTLCNRCMKCTDAEGGCPVSETCYIGLPRSSKKGETK